MSSIRMRTRLVAVMVSAAAVIVGTGTPTSATPTTTNLDVSGKRFYNACTGEYVTIVDGILHILADTRSDGAGGVHVTIRGNAQHVVAEGETTGTTYHFAGDWWGEANGRADGKPFVVQLVEVHNMISEGPSANVIVHIVSHVTVDPSGRTVVSVESLSSECRG